MSLSPTEYYYCPDYGKYVKCEGGVFYSIDDRKQEVIDEKRFKPILIGEIFTIDITREEYEAHRK
ncbi:hypothetical protein K5I04_01280 [Murdochiella sp. Marseille-P8839]|nr:hypothetical protein [Murdochiella sp. Marseille-P8839]